MRYAIQGFRPGETFVTPAGEVKTNENDGGADLTDDQIAYFKQAGFTIVKVANTPPDEPGAPMDPAAADVLASQQRAEAQAAQATLDAQAAAATTAAAAASPNGAAIAADAAAKSGAQQ